MIKLDASGRGLLYEKNPACFQVLPGLQAP
jgi:hypothetical protein